MKSKGYYQGLVNHARALMGAGEGLTPTESKNLVDALRDLLGRQTIWHVEQEGSILSGKIEHSYFCGSFQTAKNKALEILEEPEDTSALSDQEFRTWAEEQGVYIREEKLLC